MTLIQSSDCWLPAEKMPLFKSALAPALPYTVSTDALVAERAPGQQLNKSGHTQTGGRPQQ